MNTIAQVILSLYYFLSLTSIGLPLLQINYSTEYLTTLLVSAILIIIILVSSNLKLNYNINELKDLYNKIYGNYSIKVTQSYKLKNVLIGTTILILTVRVSVSFFIHLCAS